MIAPNHHIDIYVNGQLLDQPTPDGISLSINNVIFDPSELKGVQSEYSFEFQLPCTPTNNKVFDHANVLAKPNKFKTRYSATVNCDGNLIFDGSLVIQSVEDDSYNCNLVNIKINSLDDIFGDAVMTDIPWYVQFNGAETINEVNQNTTSKYYFPFVCYGAFYKTPEYKDEVGEEYTSKFEIDKYNKFWHTSFAPSPNAMELIRKAFEWKGYSLAGDAIRDPLVSQVYASANMAQEQVGKYNLGNPKFGKISISSTFTNKPAQTIDGITANGRQTQELKFKYDHCYSDLASQNYDDESVIDEWNFSSVDWWNMYDTENNSGITVNVESGSTMFDPDDNVIVIPEDGWYKITLEVNMMLCDPLEQFHYGKTARQPVENKFNWHGYISGTKDVNQFATPYEVQLIRNYSDDIELIKGKWNYRRVNLLNNQWITCFPHEAFPLGMKVIDKRDTTTSSALTASAVDNSKKDEGIITSTTRPAITVKIDGTTNKSNVQYVYHNDHPLAFDPIVSKSFICGLSTMSSGTPAVMKDGKSWSSLLASEQNNVLCNVRGYDKIDNTSGTEVITSTDKNYNRFKDAPQNYAITSNSALTGRVTCCVELKRNDKVQLALVQRHYDISVDEDGDPVNGMDAVRLDSQAYGVSGRTNLTIEAVSNQTKAQLRSIDYGYDDPTQLSELLNICDFQNKEKKISDWIDGFAKAFNLSIYNYGNTVEISTNKPNLNTTNYAVDIDDRVSSSEAKTERIEYPSEMAVKYTINTDEWGFERTVPELYINASDWKSHGDSGYTVIKLADDTYTTKKTNISVPFSYTYYDTFLWKEVLSSGTETSISKNIRIPVIELSRYMADGYGYKESMAHDGYSLNQRFWFRQPISDEYVWTADVNHDKVFLTYPINSSNNFNLSYKNTEKSILTDFFNCTPLLSSNFVNLDTYITSQEYINLRAGANVKFDSDLYMLSEIEGYEPSTGDVSLKLVKK